MSSSKKKGVSDLAILAFLAGVVLVTLFIGGVATKTIGAGKEKLELKKVVDFYINLDDKGTEFSLLESKKNERKFIEIFGIMASGAKVEGDLKTQLEALEETLDNMLKNSEKRDYYIVVMNSSGDVVYEKKTADPSLIVGIGAEDIEFGWPLETKYLRNRIITSGFGWRDHPVQGEYAFHGGVDIDGDIGDPVFYTGEEDGTVFKVDHQKNASGESVGFGIYVVIEYISPVTKIPYHVYYGHLKKVDVRVGDTVKNGDKIGEVGATGTISGSHLHFEIRKDENSDNVYEYREESVNPCFYIDLQPANNPQKCIQRCAVYEDPSVCETVTTILGTSSVSIVKNRFDIPLLNNDKGSLELILW